MGISNPRSWSGLSREEKDRQNAQRKVRKEELKVEVFTHYSGGTPRCACCGEQEYQFLTLDHIEGGGREHRCELVPISQRGMFNWIKREGFPPIFQVLCYNCNCGRQWNSGVCPHKEA